MAHRTNLEDLTPAARETVAENMKERIYSTITLLALMAAMWSNAEHHSALGAIVAILGAVVALWAATLIAARMSYRAIYGKPISHNGYLRAIFTSSGLLAPAIAPIIIILLGQLTHWYDLKMALGASMIVMLFSLFVLSFTAGRKIYDNTGRLILVSLLEMSVGVGVILLKLAVGE